MSELRSIHSREDADALVLGLALMSTGGGGLPYRGRDYLYELLQKSYEITWVPVEELPPDALTCSVFGMGSVAPHPRMDPEEMRRFGVAGEVVSRPGVRALQELGAFLGREVQAVVPVELGGFNTVIAIDTATRLGLPVVDGDYVGRALPEMSQALPASLGLSPWPLVICDHWGTALFMKDCPSAEVAERVGKMVSTVTKLPDMLATCAHAAYPMPVERARPAVVSGSLSRALSVGRAVLEARTTSDDPIRASLDPLEGFLLFRGEVREMDWADRNGYMIGFNHLEGKKAFLGHEGKVWFQNENHVFWNDGKVRAMSPDLIAVVADPDGEPKTNTELQVGDSVAVLGFRCSDKYRSGPALAATQPRHYGIELDYAPIELLQEE